MCTNLSELFVIVDLPILMQGNEIEAWMAYHVYQNSIDFSNPDGLQQTPLF